MRHTSSSTCPYCLEPVVAEDDDEDPPDAHRRCVEEDPTGEFVVVMRRCASMEPMVVERRYSTARRAYEVEVELRLDHPAVWPCGRTLDIIVAAAPRPVVDAPAEAVVVVPPSTRRPRRTNGTSWRVTLNAVALWAVGGAFGETRDLTRRIPDSVRIAAVADYDPDRSVSPVVVGVAGFAA